MIINVTIYINHYVVVIEQNN